MKRLIIAVSTIIAWLIAYNGFTAFVLSFTIGYILPLAIAELSTGYILVTTIFIIVVLYMTIIIPKKRKIQMEYISNKNAICNMLLKCHY